MSYEDPDNLMYYLGGILDGEGSVTITNNNIKGKNGKRYKSKQPQITIAMTDEEPIRLICNLFRRNMHISHKLCKSGKIMYVFHVSHRKALAASKVLLPYSICKKGKLQAIIDHYEGSRE